MTNIDDLTADERERRAAWLTEIGRRVAVLETLVQHRTNKLAERLTELEILVDSLRRDISPCAEDE